MKKKLILVSIVFISLVFLFYQFNIRKQYVNERINYESTLFENIFKNNTSLFQYDFDLIDCAGNKMSFSQVTKEKSKFIIYISSSMCERCILSQLSLIGKHLNKLNNDDIIVLADYKSINNLHIATKKYKLKHQVYLVVRNYKFPDLFRGKNEPVLFVSDSSLTYLNTYISNKLLPFASQFYYGRIEDHFKKKYDMRNKDKNGILFEKELIDLKKIKFGEDTVVRLNYVNMMEFPLIINEVNTSCGCTVVDWKKKPIAPGDSATIKIRYKVETKGSFFKSIIINSNAINNPIKILIKGESII